MIHRLRIVDGSRARSARRALFLDLAGPLRLSDADGRDLTPRSRKAQGLLALIGTSHCLRRSRIWLQDKLWSDCGPEQSAACLRQCLLRIRSALGANADCLKTENGWLAFDSERVTVRTELPRPDLGGQVEFLEGLDIRDPEFEDWLRDQRMFYWERWNQGAADLIDEQTGAGHAASSRRSAPGAPFGGPVRSAIGVASPHAPRREGDADALREFVLRLVARSLLGCAVDLAAPDNPDYLAIRTLADGAAVPASLKVEQRQEAARLALEALYTLF